MTLLQSVIVGEGGYAPPPLDFQSSASTKLASPPKKPYTVWRTHQQTIKRTFQLSIRWLASYHDNPEPSTPRT